MEPSHTTALITTTAPITTGPATTVPVTLITARAIVTVPAGTAERIPARAWAAVSTGAGPEWAAASMAEAAGRACTDRNGRRPAPLAGDGRPCPGEAKGPVRRLGEMQRHRTLPCRCSGHRAGGAQLCDRPRSQAQIWHNKYTVTVFSPSGTAATPVAFFSHEREPAGRVVHRCGQFPARIPAPPERTPQIKLATCRRKPVISAAAWKRPLRRRRARPLISSRSDPVIPSPRRWRGLLSILRPARLSPPPTGRRSRSW